jgi:hypothetical protein
MLYLCCSEYGFSNKQALIATCHALISRTETATNPIVHGTTLVTDMVTNKKPYCVIMLLTWTEHLLPSEKASGASLESPHCACLRGIDWKEGVHVSASEVTPRWSFQWMKSENGIEMRWDLEYNWRDISKISVVMASKNECHFCFCWAQNFVFTSQK